jgi:hypothetical protein
MQITVTDAQSQLPAEGKRRKLILTNTGSNILYYGWESATSADGATQGVPLLPGALVAMGGDDMGLANTLFLICAADETTTLNFTQSA